MTPVQKFFQTARERYSILLRRRQGTYKVLTNDAVFATYRFCNVFREDDKVTMWFRDNIRNAIDPDYKRDIVRACIVFRWFNSIQAGEALKDWLMGFESMADARAKLRAIVDAGKPILNPAYMIKSPKGMNKIDGLFSCIEAALEELELITTEILVSQKLRVAHELFCRLPYIGPFMAYQIVCDLRFTDVLDTALDLNEWTCPGPGSARGISRLLHGEPNKFRYGSATDQARIVIEMRKLLTASRNDELWPQEWPRWELSTVQHWACEYDKYMRAFSGEGKPKQLYHPS